MLEEYKYKSICVSIKYVHILYLYGYYGKNKKDIPSLDVCNTFKLQIIIERSI